ncbi:MFS transporter [Phaeobacter gallaeciensis]|uniref:MFS-type transporter n=1 Tax=Phaeobacter gallaeciensis TaxID=60890 RepID=A0AAC9ZAK8_9RHOB|nr:MFS transporter [Phaeobacter gallaeciensis]AHD10391.1 Arabinose efflux permease [Phaeobacter gallaeciensis DSM 26640]ATE93655.1 putative MFS-type transporter [Phaeobacter gallaeciensis]ATE96524.1 putative MFS-type transporter [Phaeobacter gallaeciensis]ATF02319.1 putative MFS-type transporter [Phaeobacter gallaeciensis]ATF06699.1 putative MFS-type transporter [Phaeobacter gallaeciensis]
MRMMISFAALFLSVILLQLSTGGVGPLDALSGITLGFDKEQIGFLGSAHFVGFFLGCWWVPRLMGNVGHSRAFAVCTALGAMGLIGHTLTEDPLAWAAMRIASGLCVAGCYTVIESWLNAKVTNETRGRAMGSYRIVDLSASLVAQLLIAVLPPAAYVSYNLLAILCCAALLPLTMTKVSQPDIPDAPRLRPKLAWACSPLAVAGVIVAALSSASFRMVGPIYGQEVGLEVGQIAFFLATFVLGGALAQYPLGWLADKYDRRWVLIWLSVVAILSCGITIAASGMGTLAVMASAAFFGFTTMPIFSVSAAHANDFATSQQRIELAAALMFFYALGAIASPLITSALIENYGPGALFAFVAVGHLGLIVFGLARMRARPAPEDRTRYVYAPRTSFTIGRLLKRSRERR